MDKTKKREKVLLEVKKLGHQIGKALIESLSATSDIKRFEQKFSKKIKKIDKKLRKRNYNLL